MESGIQSSFIPHDAGQPEKLRARGTGGLADLLLVLGIVALAASAALGGAVFLYQQYVNSVASSDVAQLQRAKQQFEPALVQQLIRLDDRMQASESILTAHIAPSAFFDVLDQVTVKTISYSSLSFEATDPRQIQIKMQGVAQSVNSIAFQDDLMSQSGVFTNPIFSNIDRQNDGVHFNVTALVNPAAINYAQLAGAGAATLPAEMPTGVATSTGQNPPPAQGTQQRPASSTPTH